MISYIDPFGRETFLEVLFSEYNKKIGIAIRKERHTIYESFDIDIVKSLVKNLQSAIEILEQRK